MKKIISVLLALLIVAAITPLAVFADGSTSSSSTDTRNTGSSDNSSSYDSFDPNTGSSGASSSSEEPRSTPKVTFYTVKASAGEGGTIDPEGEVDVRRKFDKTFTITADDGYVIADVLVDGKSVGAVEEYSFIDVRKSHRISAEFVLAPAAPLEESGGEPVEDPVEEAPAEEPEPEAPASQEPAQEQAAEPAEPESTPSAQASDPVEEPAVPEETEPQARSLLSSLCWCI